jgi:carbon storage regulator
MLVLSRQRDETIMIGDDIEITVVDIRGDKVRVGITAPSRIAVHRKEVYEAIRAENERAAVVGASEFDPGDAGPAKTGGATQGGALSPRLTPITGQKQNQRTTGQSRRRRA